MQRMIVNRKRRCLGHIVSRGARRGHASCLAMVPISHDETPDTIHTPCVGATVGNKMVMPTSLFSLGAHLAQRANEGREQPLPLSQVTPGVMPGFAG